MTSNAGHTKHNRFFLQDAAVYSAVLFRVCTHCGDGRCRPVKGSDVSGGGVVGIQPVLFPPRHAVVFLVPARHPPKAPKDVCRVVDDDQNLRIL